MKLSTETPSRHVGIVHVQGDVDGETYGQLLVEAEQQLARGTRVLLLNLTDCAYMSSAGVMALTSIFKQLRERARSEDAASWATKNTLERAGELGPPRQLALVNPCPSVARVLELAGLSAFIPVYRDLSDALTANAR
jgi:anti-anti-sigma factor